jgi:hypothetical protein
MKTISVTVTPIMFGEKNFGSMNGSRTITARIDAMTASAAKKMGRFARRLAGGRFSF